MLLYGIDWQPRGERGVITGRRRGEMWERQEPLLFRFSMEQFRSSMHLIAMSHTHPAVEPPLTAEQLPDDLATLKNMILELLVSMHQRDRDHQALQHRLELLLRRLYGPRGERFNPNQLLLFPDLPADALAASPPPTCEEKPKRKCRPHGRRRLPENLPRVPKHHELTSTPSGSVRAVAISAKRSASTPASSWITNRRRCSSSSTLSTSTPVYAVARRDSKPCRRDRR